eukprot:TRINITY_DN8714_c0_g1_i1.p1 TRINITY_DN8714_c0_g1~~TRINITY_DN8714_c0_g1_i1.p1  ORF type:complete len:293 (-),score=45.39 TRINITY_DN8714_c0_g1_i1:345-1223(-)
MSHNSNGSGNGEEEEEALEQTLLVVREVSVYKIPPRTTAGSYKCGEWLQSDKIWSGRLRVVSVKERCEIRLEDSNTGELFAACLVYPGRREQTVESVADSSRYFVLRIEDGRGKHAFIGLGFAERNEAFDFNVALSDHERYSRRQQDLDENASQLDESSKIEIHPAVNQRLKEGETIRINVKNKTSAGTGMLSAAGLGGGLSSSGKPKIALAPPPASGRIRSPLPPPPNDTVTVKNSTASGTNRVQNSMSQFPDTSRHTTDAFTDFSQLEMNLPSTNTGSAKPTSASGWAAF